MWVFYSLLNLLIPLALIGGVVAVVVAWRRREGLEAESEIDRGVGTVKRLYFYAATFAYMIVAGVGIVLLARYLLDVLFGPPVLSRDSGQLALGVALAVIWTPIWTWHRLKVRQFAKEEPAEPRSLLRKLYVYVTLGVTAALVAHASVELLRWAFGATAFRGYAIAAAVVWSAAWLFHWKAEREEGQPTNDTMTIRRVYLYVVSAFSLAMLGGGTSFVIYVVFREAYEGLFSVSLPTVGGEGLWSDATKDSLAVALAGAGLWAYHWLYVARLDTESTARQFYLYAFAVLVGAITALSATGVITFAVLQWFIGTPEQGTAAAHFRILPAALSALMAGLGLWLYHWLTLQRERATSGGLPAARRIYGYVMAALGLGALAAAIVVLVATATGIATTSATDVLAGADWWRDRIVLVLTLALLGVPVWSYHWLSMQRLAAGGDAEGRACLPRRMLVFGVIGIGALAFLGNVSYLLYVFLDALLEDALSLTLLRDAKWSMGAVVAALVFVPYYWLVLREDRQVGGDRAPRPPASRKSVTVLVPENGAPFVSRLESALSRKARVLHRLDPDVGVPELSSDDLLALERRIAEATGSRVLLVADAAGVQVYSHS